MHVSLQKGTIRIPMFARSIPIPVMFVGQRYSTQLFSLLNVSDPIFFAGLLVDQIGKPNNSIPIDHPQNQYHK